jgi:glycosyltransferase involved in cell wall biosynthesis
MGHKIIFLISSPSNYLFTSIEHFKLLNKNVEVFYQFTSSVDVNHFKDLNSKQIEKNIFSKIIFIYNFLFKRNDLLVVSGWNSSFFNTVVFFCYFFSKKIVLMFDSPIINTRKQKTFIFLFNLFIKQFYSFAWVPGPSQYLMAKKLGFKSNEIKTGLYVSNFEVNNYPIINESKFEKSEKILLYFGRFLDYKGINLICKAFIDLNAFEKKGWKLHLVGGTNKEIAINVNHQDIMVSSWSHSNLANQIFEDSHCFILSSNIENWGVSVHDAVCNGLPLILSRGVESSNYFLIENLNGYFHNKEDLKSIRLAMVKIFNLSEEELKSMSSHSRNLSKTVTQKEWNNNLNFFANY